MSVTVQTGNSVAIQTGNRVIITAPGPQGPPGSGGGGTPGGTNTQVQFNDNGSFGGDAGMTYNKATDTLSATNLTVSGLSTLNHIHGSLAGNLYVHIKNTSGVTIAKGTPVYATGSVGVSGEIEVAAADFTNSAKMPAIGITDSQLIANAEGNAVVVGEITGLATNTYTINQELFVGTAALVGTLPTTGEVQSVAIVSRVHASTGIIVVNTQARLNAALRALANNVGSGLTALNASNITSGSLADAYIASAATWNAKQNAGAYITALTGDVTASGPGSVAATLANTAVTPGSYTSANITVDSKGRVTAAANGSGGGGTPGGANTELQFNNSGAFGGADIRWVDPYLEMPIEGTSATRAKIGMQSGADNGAFTARAGDLLTSGGDAGLTPFTAGGGSGGVGGPIHTFGGDGFTTGESGGDYSGGNGGNIETNGGNASDGSNGLDGGDIITKEGGGTINTLQGFIELGQVGSRTTIDSGATTDYTLVTPTGPGTAGQLLNVASVSSGIVQLGYLSTPIGIANGGTGQTTQTAAFDALAPTTTKGDLIVHNGTDNIRVPVGADGHALVADSTQASGVKWAAGGGGSGAMVLLASASSSTRGTTTANCPIDGTIPQVSEMTAYSSLDVTVTPANALSTIVVEYEVFVSSSTVGSAPLAIFKDSNTSASTATYVTLQSTDYGLICRVRLIETAGSGARTYKLYFARQSGGSGNRYIGRSDSQSTLFDAAMLNTVTVFECPP